MGSSRGRTIRVAVITVGLLVAGVLGVIDTADAGPAGTGHGANGGELRLIERPPTALADRGPAAEGDGAIPARVDLDVLADSGTRRVSADVGDRILQMDLRPVESRSPDTSTWSGLVVGDDLSAVTIIERDGATTGVIRTTDGSLRIHADADGDGTIVPLVPQQRDGDDTVRVPDVESGESTAPRRGADRPAPTADSGPPVIRVLMVYTPNASTEVRSWNPGRTGAQARADHASMLIADTNTAYLESDVDGRLELAGITVTDREYPASGADLGAFRDAAEGGNYWENPVKGPVGQLRDDLEADLVALISTESSGGACGIAYMLEPGFVSYFEHYAYSISDVSCSLDNLTFAHELGHNMGLAHDHHIADSTENPFSPYGYGWTNVDEAWYTIQAYYVECVNEAVDPWDCTQIPRFSNPDQQWTTGSPLGSPTTGPTPADASRALNDSQWIVAGFRGAAWDPPGSGPATTTTTAPTTTTTGVSTTTTTSTAPTTTTTQVPQGCTGTSAWPCPFTSWSRFVSQQWSDFGRSGTTAQRQALVAALANGSRTAEGVIEDLRADTATSRIRSRVTRLYLAYFLRPPDLGGFDFWVGRYRTKPSITRISMSFAGSAEFRNRYGSLNNGQFVDLVYQNVLGRAPDAAGRAYWKGQLDSRRMTRGRVMVGFSDAPEFAVRRHDEIDVILLYRAMLGAPPSKAVFENEVGRLQDGDLTLHDFIRELSRRPDYEARITR